ncbi:MAG: hypothetical protein M0T81_01375 [Thermoplasmatales archaeon]|jgi:hypothetical protein|nr:hypothetical protein [Thermoplasmatales archaeon]
MSKTVLYPFNEKYVGASTVSEFRKWAGNHWEAFRHDLTTALKKDKIIFSLRVAQGKWIMIGESIVLSNHSVGTEKDTCSLCRLNSHYDKDFRVHIQTKDFREYKEDIDARDEAGITLGRFGIVKEPEYARILEKTRK